MRDEHANWVLFYLNSIRSAVAALALAVLSATFVFGGSDGVGFVLAVCSLLLLLYAFAPAANR